MDRVAAHDPTNGENSAADESIFSGSQDLINVAISSAGGLTVSAPIPPSETLPVAPEGDGDRSTADSSPNLPVGLESRAPNHTVRTSKTILAAANLSVSSRGTRQEIDALNAPAEPLQSVAALDEEPIPLGSSSDLAGENTSATKSSAPIAAASGPPSVLPELATGADAAAEDPTAPPGAETIAGQLPSRSPSAVNAAPQPSTTQSGSDEPSLTPKGGPVGMGAEEAVKIAKRRLLFPST